MSLTAPSPPALDGLTTSDGVLFWIEGRPDGDVLVRSDGQRNQDALPAGVYVRSRVHEYGGGAYLAHDGQVSFVRADDQQLWRTTPSGKLVRLTQPPAVGQNRYADLRVTPAGLLVCVRERHRDRQVINELVSLPADGSAEPTVIASGADFYAAPRPSPDGGVLAWISWNAPAMPWDATTLWIADIRPDTTLGPPTQIAGDPDESICQPLWAPDGSLHFLSDRTGWWNLYRWHHHTVTPIATTEAELAAAPWEFGYSTYQFLDDHGADPHRLNEYRIATLTQHGARHWIDLWHPTAGHHQRLELPYTSIKPYLATHQGQIAAITSTPHRGPRLVLINPTTTRTQELTETPTPSTQPPWPETIRIPTRDGNTVYGLLHLPIEPTVIAPPLLVRAHPGPTANAPLRFDPWTTFFTSHGFAVLDLDYRGSTGYGRTYRNALRGQWGVLDVTDCIDAVHHLTTTGRIDPTRVAITGSSAGGYTALRAIATSTLFVTAAVRHAIIDPARWRQAAPKFQQHHPDLLIGTDPATYQARSVLATANTISTPVLITHGEHDPITPITHARELATTLGPHATLLTYPNEAHSLQHPDNITRTLTAELNHFRHHLRL